MRMLLLWNFAFKDSDIVIGHSTCLSSASLWPRAERRDTSGITQCAAKVIHWFIALRDRRVNAETGAPHRRHDTGCCLFYRPPFSSLLGALSQEKNITNMNPHPAQLPLDQQLEHLQAILSKNTTLIEVLKRAATLNLPNWYLAAGAVSQTIWNVMTSKPPETGIDDYDLVYFDSSDLSYEAEDKHIQAAKVLFEGLPAEIEIRNQARVHLWFEKKHGIPCPPHQSVEAGIDTWISTSAMIGIRLEQDGKWTVYAPRGLSDFFNLVVRPNLILGSRAAYEKKVNRWLGIWSELNAEPWPKQT